MPARVFISCGQKGQERDVSNRIADWFRSKGYDPYVAMEVQTIRDLNAGIIEALKTSDYYVFVNLKREKVTLGNDEFYRGSLYSHQELAVAYALGFDHLLVINHKDVQAEGMQRFIVSNTPEFSDPTEILPRIQAAVGLARWTPSYSRQLSLVRLVWGDPVAFGDHAGRAILKVLHGDVQNNRTDRAAYRVVAHLNGVVDLGSGRPVEHHDRTRLKATGAISYEHVIWPASHEAFDLLSVKVTEPSLIFLNSTLDVAPRRPILSTPGAYEMRFRFIAEDYPLHERAIRLEHTGEIASMDAQIIE